ncbi:MAG: hypothetical protein JST26_09520 [Bacteroidetes bacterium]|nr:hypothetical protein [Bacteroidota bacterium]
MKKLFFLIITVAAGSLAAQQDSLTFKKTFELEVDPIAYALKGYSVHGIYNHNHFRFDLGFYGIETPGELTGNKGFTVRNSGFGLKANYMFRKVNGFYGGVDLGYGKTIATETESNLKDTGHNISVGTHIGYRFFLFPRQHNALHGLYLTPWAGISYNYAHDAITLGNYKESSLGYFATFHVGYRF